MNLEPNVEAFMNASLKRRMARAGDLINDIDYYLKQTESPIEQLMFIALKEAFECSHEHGLRYNLIPQYKIEPYRVDIFIWAANYSLFPPSLTEMSTLTGPLYVIVECDGHDYHEKTKEQARNDKQRDRYLANLGFQVLRYAGSEVVEDPGHCADDVLTYVKKRLGLCVG